MAQDENLISFRLDDEPEFEDVGVKFVGHTTSPRMVELTAVEGNHTMATSHEMTSVSWALHTFLTPPSGTFRIDSGPERCSWETAFFPPGVPVKWRSNPCVVGICHFGPQFAEGILQAEPNFGTDALNCIITERSDRLVYLGRQAYHEACHPGLGSSLLVEAIGTEIALEAIRCDRKHRPDDQPLRGGLAPWQRRRLEAYVHAHLSDDLCLQSLAALLNMSQRHLSRVVKYEKGISVHRWIADLRLALAKRLLSQTNLPLHEIASRVGFKSSPAFSTAFRLASGLSPSEYRSLALR